MDNRTVFFSHDGGLDDYLCVLLLMTMKQVRTLGIVVTPADCYIEPAVSATRKILDLMGRTDIPVAASTVRGLNPFPRRFRWSSCQLDNMPILNSRAEIRAPLANETGQEFLIRTLREAPEPVTFLETGPFTTLASALERAPDIAAKIDVILWMGGALNVPGNVHPYTDPYVDGSAEWNAYWDPIAAYQIWQTPIPIVMCPLDITNTVPLTAEFVARLSRQRRYPASDLAGQAYALVRHQPYYFWDVLTTSYLERPDLFQVREWETVIIPDGPSQGRTQVQPGGKRITALDKADVAGFYDYILAQWAC